MAPWHPEDQNLAFHVSPSPALPVMSCHSSPQCHTPALAALLTSPSSRWPRLCTSDFPCLECPTCPLSLVLDLEEEKSSLAPRAPGILHNALWAQPPLLWVSKGMAGLIHRPSPCRSSAMENIQGFQSVLESAHF